MVNLRELSSKSMAKLLVLMRKKEAYEASMVKIIKADQKRKPSSSRGAKP